jgi:signal transduction histidine kinase
VLVVDDVTSELDHVESILKTAGYDVTRAASGGEALRLAQRDPLDAVVTDVEMGGLDGFALCRLLKADPRTRALPVLFLTAHRGGESEMVRALSLGGSDYVHKPVNPEILVRRVGVLVRARRAENEQRLLAERRAGALSRLGATQAQALEARKLAGLATMARGLAHEINNPLAAAMSEVAFVASRRGSDEERDEALAAALESLARVGAIVERMRRLGEEIESPGSSSLEGVVRAAVEPLMPLLGERGIEVIVDLERCPPVPGASRMAAVIAELTSNAARAMPGGGRLEIKLRAKGSLACLTVRDEGAGMSPEAVQRAFDPFFTEKGEWRAIGLGLPMCHSTVTALEGTIEIESVPGAGTTVRITVPGRR